MKRFLTFLGTLFLSFNFFIISSFADTSIKINSAIPANENNFVDVKGKISGVNQSQQITAMVTELLNQSYDENNIVYINQIVYTEDDGDFSFSFGVKGTLKPSKAYIVRIGGTGVDSPASLIVGTTSSGEVAFVYGDATNDGEVTVEDAAIVLKYVLDPNSVEDEYLSAERFLEKINVTGGDKITAECASSILQKALKGENFLFPVQNNINNN